MKLHLPKFLLTAVLACFSFATPSLAALWGSNTFNVTANVSEDIKTSEGSADTTGTVANILFLKANASISDPVTISNLTFNNAGKKLVITGNWDGDCNFNGSMPLTITTLTVNAANTSLKIGEHQKSNKSQVVTINSITGTESLSNLEITQYGTLTLGGASTTNTFALKDVTNSGNLTLNGATKVSGTLTANSESTLTIAGNVDVTGEMKFGHDKSENAKLIVNEGSTLTAGKLTSSYGVDATINGVLDVGEDGIQLAAGPSGTKDIFAGTGTVKTSVLGVGNTATYVFQGGLRMEIGSGGIQQTTANGYAEETTVLKDVTIAVAETWDYAVTKKLSLADTATGTTFEVGEGKSAAISGVLSDYTHDSTTEAGKLVKTGAGTLTLSGNNTYSGGTTIEGGKVIVAAGSSLGSGAVAVNNSAELELKVAGDFANVISGTGVVIVNTTDTLTLKGNNTYTGFTKVSGGTLKIGSNCNTCNAYTGGVLVENGAKLDLNGKEGLYQSVVTLADGATLLNSAEGLGQTKRQMKGLTLAGNAVVENAFGMGIIAGGYAAATLDLGGYTLTKKGAGTFFMVNTSDTEDGGIIDVQAGSVQIGTSGSGANNTTTLSKVVFNLAEGTGINLVSGANLTAKAITGSGGVDGSTNSNTSLTLSSDQDNIYSGAISNKVTLNKEGSGTLTLSGNNTYSRGTTINNGKVIVAAGSSLGSGAVAVNNSSTLELQVDGTFANVISGTGSVIVDTDGTVTLKGDNNTYTGGTTIDKGKVIVAAGSSLGSGAVAVNNSAELELEVAGDFANVISGTGSVIVDTDGTVTLKGDNNTYTGGVTIDGGILKVGHEYALGSSSASSVTVNEGGTLDMNGTEDVVNAVILNGGATLTNTIANIGTTIMQLPDVTLGGNATVTGTHNFAMLQKSYGQAELDLAGHTLTKTGTNTFVLCNTTVTEGTLKVTEGTLKAWKNKTDYLDISAATVEVGRVDENNVGTFQLSGSSEAIKALNFDGGTVTVESEYKLTVSGATTVTSNGGTMQGAVQLNSLSVDGKLKIGDGSTKGVIISTNLNAQTATLGGTITSDAANTTISLAGAGVDNKAIISNALIDIMAGSTFDLSNAVVADTSRITDAAATLSVTNVQMDVTVGTNATAEASTLPDGGVTLQKMKGGSDTVNVSEGTKVLAISSTLMDTVTVSGSGLTINLNGLKDFDLTSYGYVTLSFTNADKTAASFSTNLGVTIAYAGSNLSSPVYFDTTKVSNDNNVTTLYVKVTPDFIAAVPEPTTTTLSLLALAGLAARRRRK